MDAPTPIGASSVLYSTRRNFPMEQLRASIEKKYLNGARFADYEELHAWSCTNYDSFWVEVMLQSPIFLKSDYTMVVEKSKEMAEIPKWFIGAKLNYTESLLRTGLTKAQESPDSPRPAVYSYSFNRKSVELVETATLDFITLEKQVKRMATWLRAQGIKPGDAVVGFVPNSASTVVAVLATAAVGAVWSSASLDFGSAGVLDRFAQINPKILFTVDHSMYKRKVHNLKQQVDAIVKGLPTLKKVVISRTLDVETIFEQPDLFVSYEDVLATEEAVPFVYEEVAFSAPLFYMFSSGTTGLPKCIIHSVGGTILKHYEEHVIQNGSTSDDIMFFYTTTGWMMYNWMLSFLVTGGSIVVYDESPLEPDAMVLVNVIKHFKATFFGAGATFYDRLMRLVPESPEYDESMSQVHTLLSTGSPLKPESARWMKGTFAKNIIIGSISGGTDIIGCFMGGVRGKETKVKPGQCGGAWLGMDLAAYDNDGQPVFDKDGELVCRKPFPSMPVAFGNDPEGARYKAAYFERFPGVWAHGDFCKIDGRTKCIEMLGRSDSTLNRGGVRIGTAELYKVVEQFTEVADSLVVGRQIPGEADEQIILFLRMNANESLDDVGRRIKVAIRSKMSPRHVPDYIYNVEDIPYTNSGKKVEVAVKKIMSGGPVEKSSSLRNPDALDLYVQYRLSAPSSPVAKKSKTDESEMNTASNVETA